MKFGRILENALAEQVSDMANDNLMDSIRCIGWAVLVGIAMGELGIYIGLAAAILKPIFRALRRRSIGAANSVVGWVLICLSAADQVAAVVVVWLLWCAVLLHTMRIWLWWERPGLRVRYVSAAIILPWPLLLPVAVAAKDVVKLYRSSRQPQGVSDRDSSAT